MTKPLVTIITATTGTEYLEDNIRSVLNQTYENIQHLIVIDGKHPHANVIISNYGQHKGNKIDVIELPYATGIEQYNGHRIYGGCTYFAKGEYIIYLDEDNWMEPNHVESMVEVIQQGNTWAFSLRKITDMDGNYICNDDCESLGKWESVINDFFVDVNCYMLPRHIALQFSPGWYRRARHPAEQPEVDRLLSWYLRENNFTCNTNGEYTINYRAGNRADSVQAKFFIDGNELMKQKYNGEFPWRKKTS
jgi:glycosyltransferase involved in cell wall biosynthesis